MLQMHEISFVFYSEAQYSRGQSLVENNIAFVIGLLFVSLSCTRNDMYNIQECGSVCVLVCVSGC